MASYTIKVVANGETVYVYGNGPTQNDACKKLYSFLNRQGFCQDDIDYEHHATGSWIDRIWTGRCGDFMSTLICND